MIGVAICASTFVIMSSFEGKNDIEDSKNKQLTPRALNVMPDPNVLGMAEHDPQLLQLRKARAGVHQKLLLPSMQHVSKSRQQIPKSMGSMNQIDAAVSIPIRKRSGTSK